MLEKVNKERNYWQKPLFWYFVALGLLMFIGPLLSGLGFAVNEDMFAPIVGQLIVLGIIGLVLFIFIKNYKLVLIILTIILLIGLLLGILGWFFTLPATTIIIILLILLFLK